MLVLLLVLVAVCVRAYVPSRYVNGDQTQLLGKWMSLEIDAPSPAFLESHSATIFVSNPARRRSLDDVDSSRAGVGVGVDDGHRRQDGAAAARFGTGNPYAGAVGAGGAAKATAGDRPPPRGVGVPSLEVVLPQSRMILSNMPLSKTIQISFLRLRLETVVDEGDDEEEDQEEISVGMRSDDAKRNSPLSKPAAITRQNVEFHVTSMHARLLETHIQWLLTSVSTFSELLEDHRLRNVFSFERTIWSICGAWVFLFSRDCVHACGT